MPSVVLDERHRLLAFNQQLIEQALALVEAHLVCVEGVERITYAGLAGSHIRHLIEHYEALLLPTQAGVADYDARLRDPWLDVNPYLARTRLQALRLLLANHDPEQLSCHVLVRGQGGLAGNFNFEAPSSLGRELAYMASHTVHHFALLAGYCQQHGIATPRGFGKAPATRAHEELLRLRRRA